jgi:hypothetical protein
MAMEVNMNKTLSEQLKEMCDIKIQGNKPKEYTFLSRKQARRVKDVRKLTTDDGRVVYVWLYH